MKLNNYLLPGLLGGFAAGVLSSVPGLKNLCCCLVVPLASFFAVYLHKKSSNTDLLEFKSAAIVGLLTGVFSAFFSTVFEVFFTLISHTNDFVESLPQTEIAVKGLDLGPIFDNTFEIMKQMSKEIIENGFSLLYTIGIFFSNLITGTILGFAGGLAAKSYYNRRVSQE